MERTRYTISEARAALGGIDAKTILDWIEKATPKIVPTIDKRDQRRKFISAADLGRLADEHERQLAPLDDAPRTMAAALAVIARQTETIAALQARVTALEARPTLTAPHYAAQTDETMKDTNYPAQSHVGAAVARRFSPSPSVSYALPDGMIAVERFAHQQGVPVQTLRNAIEDGRLTETHGEWKVQRATVRHAFTWEQQRQAVITYRSHARWSPCDQPDCPCHASAADA